VPVVGEKIEIPEEHLVLDVLSVDDRRIRKIRLTRTPPAEVPEDIREEPAPEAD
jgi:CBS domain containing-hemolysin-like protein